MLIVTRLAHMADSDESCLERGEAQHAGEINPA